MLLVKQHLRNKRSRASVAPYGVLFASILSSTMAAADPQGGVVTNGLGNISATAAATQIQQFSHSMVVDWQSFNIAANETVNFIQPGTSSAVLNRINNQLPSEIFGSLNANGLVFLMNQSGIIFGENSG